MNRQTFLIKKRVYVLSFGFLGLLMGLVVYGLISLILLQHGAIINETVYYWILLLGGAVAGIFEGVRWWDILYVRKLHLHWNKSMLEGKLLGLVLLIIITIAVIFLSNYGV